MASVTISDVTKNFGAVSVLRGVNVAIQDGAFVVLVGPSGCGKSTLLRMVAGLETVTSGEIAIDGRRVNHLEPKDRDIAMVFQNYALYPQMTVAQNMGFALELAGRPRAEIAAEVGKAAEILSERAAKKMPMEPVVMPLAGSACGEDCACAAVKSSEVQP